MEGEHPILGGEMSSEAMQEARIAALEAKRKADETRDFVLAKFQHLMGYKYLLEIYSIANLPNHNCLIMNDHFLLSYVEAEEILKSLGDIEENG